MYRKQARVLELQIKIKTIQLCFSFSYILNCTQRTFYEYCILYKIMQTDQLIVNCVSQPSKTLLSSRPDIHLLPSLTYFNIQNKSIITFYEGKTHITSTPFVITPIDFIHQDKRTIIIYQNYGQKVNAILDVQQENLIKQNFLKQVLEIYVHFHTLIPVVTLQTLYYQRFQIVKALVTDACQDEEVYINNFKQTIKLVYKTDKSTLQKVESIVSYQDISVWQASFLTIRQPKTILQLIQLKNNAPKITGKTVQMTEDEIKWIFKTAGFADIPKYQLIYNGIENYFDPAPLLKSINKVKVFFFIQNNKRQRIAFFPSVKADITPNQLFGNYYPDKQKKSVLLGIDKRSVHFLQDQSNAVGYGQQILLAIGKLDLVFSAFNGSNLSYFPMCYGKDKGKCETAQQLLGRQFTLGQFQAYKMS